MSEAPKEDTARFEVREAAPHERDAALAVTLASYEEYRSTMGPNRWSHYCENITETVLHDSSAVLIVALLDGRPVGSVLYYDDRASRFGAPYLRLLAVHPEARGHGVGRAIMDACLQRAREAGALDTPAAHHDDDGRGHAHVRADGLRPRARDRLPHRRGAGTDPGAGRRRQR